MTADCVAGISKESFALKPAGGSGVSDTQTYEVRYSFELSQMHGRARFRHMWRQLQTQAVQDRRAVNQMEHEHRQRPGSRFGTRDLKQIRLR